MRVAETITRNETMAFRELYIRYGSTHCVIVALIKKVCAIFLLPSIEESGGSHPLCGVETTFRP
jgi:hypothetical protein